MVVILEKCSLPDVWRRDFDTLSFAVDELRRHVCGDCLAEVDGGEIVDHGTGGSVFECRDPIALLNTSCGCEFELDGDHGLWAEPEDIDPGMQRRVSRRKVSKPQILAG